MDACQIAALAAERDLYRTLLDTHAGSDLEDALPELLRLVVVATRASGGYIGIVDPATPDGEVLWWASEGIASGDLPDVRASLASWGLEGGISAHDGDEVFTAVSGAPADRGASRAGFPGWAVPLGEGRPCGVLYLRGHAANGAFPDARHACVEALVRGIQQPIDGLLLRHRTPSLRDSTLPYRSRIRVASVAGTSEAIACVLRDIAMVAPRRVTILLTGPSGTGKTHLARIVHANSPRATKPFVELNCATLPEALVESELFGAMPGAHSTATRRIEGKVAAAEGGTLFLDEISELPLGAQSKLLQLLQSLEYFPLGASKPLRADVRIIAATNVDLREAVARRAFREDLLYRLQVVPIRVPPLSARREDIGELLRAFSARSCEAHDVECLEPSASVLRVAEDADWPGNVRQLENAVEAAVIRAAAEGATRIEVRHLFPSEVRVSGEGGQTFQSATRRFQAQLVLRTLEATAWNVVEAARRLEITRSHLYNLIRAHGLERAEKEMRHAHDGGAEHRRGPPGTR